MAALWLAVLLQCMCQAGLTIAAWWAWAHGTTTFGQGPVNFPLPSAPQQFATPKIFNSVALIIIAHTI